MRAAPPSVATAPLRSSAPRQHCLGLRGGIDPSIVTGVVVGFLLSRCLAGLEPQFTPEGDRGALASKARGKRQGAGGGPGGRNEKRRQSEHAERHPFLRQLASKRERARGMEAPEDDDVQTGRHSSDGSRLLPAAAHPAAARMALRDVKLVLVVRSDLKMSPGKIASQCAHAAIGAFTAAARPLLDAWDANAQAKIVVQVTHKYTNISYQYTLLDAWDANAQAQIVVQVVGTRPCMHVRICTCVCVWICVCICTCTCICTCIFMCVEVYR